MRQQWGEAELRQLFRQQGFIAESQMMEPVLRQAGRAATASDITILIEGQTGTGKQVLARAIHALDAKRCGFPFVTVHCSTIPEALAESELFGHQRGSFSGATGNREGLFQAAEHGTLFLDDVKDLPLNLQPKLLDSLQRGVIRQVGADRESPVDVRIISAANRPLAPLVEKERFREDLYHRLNVVKIRLPGLDERREDLEPLMLAFASRHRKLYPDIASIDRELLDHLRNCSLSGNVRELEHAVERMLFLKSEGNSLSMADWNEQAPPASVAADPINEAAQKMWSAVFDQGIPWDEAMQRLEAKLLERIAGIQGQTRREIASRLQTSERTLYHKLREHKLAHVATA